MEARTATGSLAALDRWLARPTLHRWGPPLLLLAVLLYYLGYVKDDAYISFRYAANWARGAGLVFNPGDRVEGYTNFLWTAAIAALLRAGVPAIVGAKVLGAITALLGLLWVRRLALRLAPDRPEAADRAAWLYAASPTVGLWAASGMEPTAAAALAAGAALLTLRAARTRRWGDGALAGGALAACALLRPEGHVLLALALLAPRALPSALLLLVPYHLARHAYFGDWLPNTFLVKANADSIAGGLMYAGQFLLFYGHGLLLVLALHAAWRGRTRPALLLGAVALAFVAYLVYIGDDEMRWFRLYAPALPFLLALAARSLPTWALIPFLLCGLVTHVTAWPLRTYLQQGDRAYRAMADVIASRARPGDRALFQDAGATPYRALDVTFDDPIGVVDRRVARMFAAAHWSPFRGGGPVGLEQRLREELLSRNPRFIAFVAYVPRPERAEVRARVATDAEGTLRRYVEENGYYYGIATDGRFRAGFRFVGSWRRNDGYYLVLYERRS
jgi:hypothetical protein